MGLIQSPKVLSNKMVVQCEGVEAGQTSGVHVSWISCVFVCVCECVCVVCVCACVCVYVCVC